MERATPAQIRAARALLNLTQEEIATRAKLSVPTIKRVESEWNLPVSAETLSAVVLALKKAGVIFIQENGDGPGVRLRKRT